MPRPAELRITGLRIHLGRRAVVDVGSPSTSRAATDPTRPDQTSRVTRGQLAVSCEAQSIGYWLLFRWVHLEMYYEIEP